MKAVQEKPELTSTKKLAGKVALITGGSRGIGAAIAERLAAEGAHIAISYAKNKSSAENVVSELNKHNIRAAAYKADVSTGNQNELIDQVIKEFGKIDILINNAGVFESQPLENITLEHYNRVFGVNVQGVVATTVAAASKLSEGGRIINISSVAAKTNAPGFSIYAATKAALDALTRVWSQELGKRKITVNAVAPGTTASDMYEEALPDEVKNEIPNKTALGRVGQPGDIAAVVAFLASEDGGWVTGQSITADGGLNF